MKLAVPYIGELTELDARLMRLADFLGISCEMVALDDAVRHAEFLERAVSEECSCCVVNPQVLQQWAGVHVPPGLVNFLLSRFTHLLIYGLRVDAYHSELVSALSQNRLNAVEAIDGEHSMYTIGEHAKDICEAFAGLAFGPVNRDNDHVLRPGGDEANMRSLISIGDRPFMAVVKNVGAQVVAVASEDVADLDTEVGDSPLREYFSRFMAYAMALRYIAGEECWRPCGKHASVIIDDPLLRPSYGFLNFRTLLELMKQHNFQTTIAFIPYNCRRSRPSTVKAFRENPDRLSICFHGNDHTGAEFASTDPVRLHTMLHDAERRIDLHTSLTRLECDRVMVFPQGRFSGEAMSQLKAHNFDAAVNTVSSPMHTQIALTLGDLAQPAVLRYEGFPLFLRKYSARIQSDDVAFNLFFGRPNFVVEHHDIFRDPSHLIAAIAKINSADPDVCWSSVGKAVSGAILRRRTPGGVDWLRGYARTLRITNRSGDRKRVVIEWCGTALRNGFESVQRNGMRTEGFEVDDAGVRGVVDLAAGVTETFSLVDRNPQSTPLSFGLRHKARAFVRRRLSEVRDNVVSKNPPLLALAKTVQQKFRH